MAPSSLRASWCKSRSGDRFLLTMDEKEVADPDRVYGPKDWRELNAVPVPSLPGGSVLCAAIKDNGEVCGNRAVGGTPLCQYHGGTTMSVQAQARRRIDMVRSELFELLTGATKEAAETYIMIMRTGKRDADRLRAADRVLELVGFRDTVANVPGAGPVSDIDQQLAGLLKTATEERLKRAIEVTSSEASDDGSGDAAA